MENPITIFNESGIEVLVREDGYVNATALCKQANKLFKDYYKTDTTKAFLETLSSVRNIVLTNLVQTKRGGTPQEQGTWVHELVAVNLAQWLDPKYAVLVTMVMQKFHRGELIAQPQPIQAKALEVQTSGQLFQGTLPVYQLIYDDKNQALLATDKVVKKTTSVSMLELGEVKLVATNQEVLLTATEIGQKLGGLSAIKVNKILAKMGFQTHASYKGKGGKIKKRWELNDAGKKEGMYLDTGRKHSDGVPVRNIQWHEGIVDVIKERSGEIQHKKGK